MKSMTKLMGMKPATTQKMAREKPCVAKNSRETPKKYPSLFMCYFPHPPAMRLVGIELSSYLQNYQSFHLA